MKFSDMKRQDLSEDTLVVLLLCGRFGGEKQDPYQPLSPREYGELAKWLNSRGLRPADLLVGRGQGELSTVQEARLERKRVEFLLARGTALALAMERWARGGLWVISRGDSEFPKRLKRHLKHAAPPLLYGSGNKALLEAGGLAIIGSRDASESALAYTRAIAARCAKEGIAVVSGGARGVDAAAMQGATEGGGHCIGVLANDLLKTSVNRQNRIGLQEGNLVLVSPFFPEAGFNAGNAMGRNRYIYTLADQALVVDSALRSGGTWEGAVEDLKHAWVPLYVRTPGEGLGNAALIASGAIPFNVAEGSTETLLSVFAAHAKVSVQGDEVSASAPQPDLLSAKQPSQSDADSSPASDSGSALLPESPRPIEHSPASAASAATPELCDVPSLSTSDANLDMFADFTARLTPMLSAGPLTDDEVAILLCIEKSQAKVWLKRATEAGLVEKLKKPVRYALGRQSALC